MSKGLEALDRIINEVEKDSRTASFLFHDIESWDKDKELVKKELKEYEKMKAIKGTTTFDKAIEDTLINACPDVAKKLKVLEIIKNHIGVIKGYIYTTDSQITDSEYELLCEVLR